MNFSGQHVVITGASTGIGRATAARVAKAGGKVSLIARRQALLDELCDDFGPQARAWALDVADQSALVAALDAAVKESGPVDGLFLNAGATGEFVTPWDYSDEAFEHVLTVNLKSPFWAARHAVPAMIARGKGSVLMTGSLSSVRGMAGNIGYVISKHALNGLATSIAAESARSGVRCNCILPGFIDTPILEGIPEQARSAMAARCPQGRIGTADEAAAVAAFLLSDESSHVTGQTWAVDGGLLGTIAI